MPPKKPSELKEQIERENAEETPLEGKERTSEGLEVSTPTRGDFFGNLEKVSRPEGDDSTKSRAPQE